MFDANLRYWYRDDIITYYLHNTLNKHTAVNFKGSIGYFIGLDKKSDN